MKINKLGFVFLLLIMLICVLSTPAFSSFEGFLNQDGSFTLLNENELFPGYSELDEYPDSIYYWPIDAPTINLWTTQNYWFATRYACPAGFTLQGGRFRVYNEYDQVVNAKIYITENSDNETPGDPIGADTTGLIWEGPGEVIPSFGWHEFELDEADYLTFEEGDEFWLLLGPSPGGNPNDEDTGWWSIGADNITGHSAYCVAGQDSIWFALQNSNCQYLTAGGELEGFWDLGVQAVYNDFDRFFMLHGTEENPLEVQLSTYIKNNGTEPSEAVHANFVVTNELSEEVYNDSTEVPVIEPGDSTIVDAPSSWTTPPIVGRYIVTVTLMSDSLDFDADEENNSNTLLQTLIEDPGWYIYDDGTFESSSVYGPDLGNATAFKPAVYPAAIHSISVWIEGEPENPSDLQLWHLVADQLTLLWEDDTMMLTGEQEVGSWNEIEIPLDDFGEPLRIEEGYFVVAQLESGEPFYKDRTPPNSSDNIGMHAVDHAVDTGGPHTEMSPTTSGNFTYRAYIGEAMYPVISFPDTILTFADTDAGSTSETELIVENTGSGTAIIESVILGQAIQNVIVVDEELPVNIAPGEEDSLTLAWTPDLLDPQDLDNEIIRLTTNDPAEPVNGFMIRLNGLANAVSVEQLGENIPNTYFLAQNFPNPFNPVTSIKFGLKNQCQIQLRVYNLTGQLVSILAEGSYEAGHYEFVFNAENLASGMYFYQLETNNFSQLRKMILMK